MKEVHAKCLLYAISIAKFAWESALIVLQISFYNSHTTMPSLLSNYSSQDEYDTTREYAVNQEWYSIAEPVLGLVVRIICLETRLFYHLWRLTTAISCGWQSIEWLLYAFITTIAPSLVSTAFTVGLGYSPGEMDTWCGLAFASVRILSAILILLHVPPYKRKYTALLLMTLTTAVLYMDFAQPLWESRERLPSGENITTQANELAARVGFPASEIYVKEDGGSRAHFSGLFFAKRVIVSSDLVRPEEDTTLTERHTLALMAHELGHYSHNHMIFSRLCSEVSLYYSNYESNYTPFLIRLDNILLITSPNLPNSQLCPTRKRSWLPVFVSEHFYPSTSTSSHSVLRSGQLLHFRPTRGHTGRCL